MLKFKVFLLILGFILQAEAFAKLKKVQVRGKDFLIYKPATWQDAAGFMGEDFTLLGPYEKGRRPVIAISQLPEGKYKFFREDFEKSESNYQAGRMEWLQKNKGTEPKFFPYRLMDWQAIKSVHTIGYTYKMGGHQFIEHAYFFQCKKKIYNVSTLMTMEQFNANKKDIHQIFNRMTCL